MDGHERSPNPRYLDGDKLRRARIAAGMDQATLADKAGTKQNQIAHHEAKNWGCHMRQLVKYAEALGVEPKALMLDEVLEPADAAESRAA
jgi:transcriptional regulator with XRE-family HTH domain